MREMTMHPLDGSEVLRGGVRSRVAVSCRSGAWAGAVRVALRASGLLEALQSTRSVERGSEGWRWHVVEQPSECELAGMCGRSRVGYKFARRSRRGVRSHRGDRRSRVLHRPRGPHLSVSCE